MLDRKIEETAVGLQTSYSNKLRSISEYNASTIVDYIAAMKIEVNLSDNYRRDIIEVLCRFSRYNENKPFSSLTRASVVTFLESFRKTEPQDPMHKWIGTYNIFGFIYYDFSSGFIILILNRVNGLNLQW
jgi:hypothetical protein